MLKNTSIGERITLVLVLVCALAGAMAAIGLENLLTVGGFKNTDSSSYQAQQELEKYLHVGAPNLIVRIGAKQGDVDAPSMRATAKRVTDEIDRYAEATSVQSYWSTGLPYLKASDGKSGLILAQLSGNEDAVDRSVRSLGPQLASLQTSSVTVGLTGQAEILREATDVSKQSLIRAELIAVPISLVLLVFLFGSLPAAAIPVLTGLVCSLCSMLVIRILAHIVPISVFALNLTTGLALGLAIDYSLLIVARYREILRDVPNPSDQDYRDAADRAVARTRRTVAVSTATIAISLAGILIINLGYLRSIALTGIVVVSITALLVLVVMPIMLRLLGRRIDSLAMRRVDLATPGSMMRRCLGLSARHPVIVSITAIGLLFVLLSPFFGVKFGPVDDRILPADSAAHHTADIVRAEYPRLGADIAFAALPPTMTVQDGHQLATTLSKEHGVSAVLSPWGTYSAGFTVAPGQDKLNSPELSAVAIVPDADLDQQQLLQQARSLRRIVGSHGGSLAGTYADELDKESAITSRAPLVLAVVALALLPMVFLATGSVVVAIKTMFLTALSLTASFGAVVWIFQRGNLSGLLNFTPTGTVDVTAPLLLVCLAFGLSLDYQIMLLSRIREEYDLLDDTAEAVRVGTERTAKVLSAAALLVGVVFIAIGSGGTTIVKILGIGLACAVVLDAFVVRIALVPALMQLLGKWNWWAPKPLARIYQRTGLEHSHPVEPAVPPTAEPHTVTAD